MLSEREKREWIEGADSPEIREAFRKLRETDPAYGGPPMEPKAYLRFLTFMSRFARSAEPRPPEAYRDMRL